VSINGIPWLTGKYCLYRESENTELLLGQVTKMFYARSVMDDEFVIFQITNKPITSYHGHYCLYTNNNPTIKMVLWSLIAWKCKVMTLPSGSEMALPIACCKSHELEDIQ
jgi:hypothetical protein